MYNFTYFPWKILTLNTQSQELYVSLNPLNLRKGFTPIINKAFMRQVINIYIISGVL